MESKNRQIHAGQNLGRPTTTLSGSENSIAFMKYFQLFFIVLDICCNLCVDSAVKDPIVILVAFGLQGISLIINFVMYIMGTASLAMTVGLRGVRVHQANLVMIMVYFILTVWWYILALRATWSSVHQHFSFTFIEDTEEVKGWTKVVHSPLPNQKLGTNSSAIDFHIIWDAGFTTLYTIQRTVAVVYYVLYIQALFLLLNGTLIEELEGGSKVKANVIRGREAKSRMSIATVSRLLR